MSFATILALPIVVATFLLFLCIWLALTITGIGPITQYFCKQRDEEILDREKIIQAHPDMSIITVPGNINGASDGLPYKVFARFSRPSTVEASFAAKYPPICIPNGLGATCVTISILHEALVHCGFTVLSFDRLGVGFSDDNVSGKSPMAEDVVREMDFVMNTFFEADTKWILIGPSMGSIVSQCYIAAYPHKVLGLLNMDGLPYPFAAVKEKFYSAAKIYNVYGHIIWTGVLRPFLAVALNSKKMRWLLSDAFGYKVVKAQFNQVKFYTNLALEMKTMMDCCDFVNYAWGQESVLKVEKEMLKVNCGFPSH